MSGIILDGIRCQRNPVNFNGPRSLFPCFILGLENMRDPASLLKEYVYASVNDEFNEFDNG